MNEPRVRIDVWSDFNCPWCFLASTSLEALQESHSVDVIWHSFELRPKGSPPMSPEYKARIEANRPRLETMARENYGVELNRGPFGLDSRPALIGARYAEAQNKGAAYHKAVMRAYWLHARDISDLPVLADIAEGVGLERGAFLAALEDPAYDAEVQQDIDQAHEYGLNSVPSMVFDNRYLVAGAQPYPVLVQATEHVQAELAKTTA